MSRMAPGSHRTAPSLSSLLSWWEGLSCESLKLKSIKEVAPAWHQGGRSLMHDIKHQGGGSCMAMRMPVRPSGRLGGYRLMGGVAGAARLPAHGWSGPAWRMLLGRGRPCMANAARPREACQYASCVSQPDMPGGWPHLNLSLRTPCSIMLSAFRIAIMQ